VTSLGFVLSIVLLLLKAFAIGSFAAISWWIVALPLIIAVVIDILIFALFGFTAFKVFDRL